MSDDVLGIRVAGPAEIRARSSGEVRSPDLLNRRTRRPAYDGLFCEEIFGDVGDAHARRTRWGHVDLAGPVVHCWFYRGEPSVLGRLLGLAEKELDRVVNYAAHVVLDPGPTPLRRGKVLTEADLHAARTAHGETFAADTGAPAARRLLDGVALPSGDPAGWLVLDCLPVLPPGLRPLRLRRDGSVAPGDLNELYQRVINRNNRLRKLVELNAPPVIVRNEMRMLQQSVDALFDNGQLRQPVLGRRGRPLRSLADRVERRLTRDLLSKRADYSGRARVVPAPDMPPGTCGLPRSLARVLYAPFGDDLARAMRLRPVLLDLRAFDAIPTDAEVIRLHPLDLLRLGVACGDVVSVHLPLSNQARAEAALLLRPTGPPPSSPPEAIREAEPGMANYFLAAGQLRRDRRAAARHRRRVDALTRWLARRMVTADGVRAALAVGAACGRLGEEAVDRVVDVLAGRGVPREDEADLATVLAELRQRRGFLARAVAGDFRRVLATAASANPAEPVDGLTEKALLGRLVEE